MLLCLLRRRAAKSRAAEAFAAIQTNWGRRKFQPGVRYRLARRYWHERIGNARLFAFGSHSRGGKSLEQVPDRGVDFPDLRVTTGSELRGNRTRAAQN